MAKKNTPCSDRSGRADQRIIEKCPQNHLNSSKRGTQSNSGGKSTKLQSCALPAPALQALKKNPRPTNVELDISRAGSSVRIPFRLRLTGQAPIKKQSG